MCDRFATPPRTTQGPAWADYWELLCLQNTDREVSKADLADRIHDSIMPGELGPDAQWAQRIDDWFRHLSYRVSAFGGWYPFRIVDGDVLEVIGEWTDERRFYVFLLMASNLRYFEESIQLVTKSFEHAALQTLRRMFPEGSNAHLFGPGQGGRYTGNLWNKMKALAEDLNERVIGDPEDFPPRRAGDGGLDLVAWVPSGDDQAGKMIAFGQCACTEDWELKQYTSSDHHWRDRIRFLAPPANVTFLPLCFRRADGEWFRRDMIHSTVVIDRVRFTRVLQDEDPMKSLVGVQSVIDATIEETAPLF